MSTQSASGRRSPRGRASDPDAEAQEVLGAERLRDRPEAVVPGEPATHPRLEAARLEIALVVHHEDRVGLNLEERRGRCDRAAGLVHIRLGCEERDTVAVDPNLGDAAVELAAPRPAVPACELVDHHVPDVVAIPGVLSARVPQSHDQQVERRRAFAPSPGQAHGGLLLGVGARRRRLPRQRARPSRRPPRRLRPLRPPRAPRRSSSRASWTLAMTTSSGSSRSLTPSGTSTCERRRASPTPSSETSASRCCGTSSGSASIATSVVTCVRIPPSRTPIGSPTSVTCDRRLDRLVEPDFLQVDVDDRPAHLVALEFLEDRRVRGAAVDLDVEHGVRAGGGRRARRATRARRSRSRPARERP